MIPTNMFKKTRNDFLAINAYSPGTEKQQGFKKVTKLVSLGTDAFKPKI